MILSILMTVAAQFAILSPVFADINKGLTGIGAGLAVGLAAIGPALGEGQIVSTAIEGMSRNPETADNLRATMILGCAIDESTGIYGLLVAILLIFVY
jgi:F-type H+-transporting ATPase subunit c